MVGKPLSYGQGILRENICQLREDDTLRSPRFDPTGRSFITEAAHEIRLEEEYFSSFVVRTDEWRSILIHMIGTFLASHYISGGVNAIGVQRTGPSTVRTARQRK